MIFILIFEISCICAGILLALTHLDKLDGKSNFFNNVAEKLRPFNTVLGIITLAIGVIYLINIKCLIFGIIGIACGLLLLPQQLSKVPLLGGFLFKISNIIKPYNVIVGDAAIILGILGLLNMNPFCN
jgi:hypothetical protein